MSRELEKIYQKILINEISNKWVADVLKTVDLKKLPFDDLFDGKYRIILDQPENKIYSELLKDFKQIPNYSGFDPEKKEIIKKIKIDPKYGGEKEQRIAIGRAINILKIDPEKKKKYLNWYANYNSNIQELESGKKYTIILSRHPVDILRMSDIGNIDSCHAENGSYFQCAVQEAKTGGLIAYICKSSDVEKYFDNLQDEEFFDDSDRGTGIGGVAALSRLRVRRYYNDQDEYSIAIPEVRIYGSRIPNFYETVKSFLKQKQKLDLDNVYVDYTNGSIVRTGGSYTDSSDSELFNRFFETEIFKGSVQHEDNDENHGRAEQFEEELQEFQDRYADFKYFSCEFDVQDEYDVYYYVDNSVSLNIPKDLELSDDFYKIIDMEIYSIRAIKNYDPNGNNDRNWLPREFDQKTGLKFQKFFNYLEENDIDNFFTRISRFFDISDNKIHIEMEFLDESNIGYNTDDYRTFLMELKDWDNNFQKIEKIFIQALVKFGFIKNLEKAKKYAVIDDDWFEKFNDGLKMVWGKKDKDYSVDLYLYDSSYDQKMKNSIYDDTGFIKTQTHIMNTLFEKAVCNYIEKYFKPSPPTNDQQLSFKNFFESTQTQNLNYNVVCSLYHDHVVKLIYTPKYWESVDFERIKFLDDNLKIIQKIFQNIFYKNFDVPERVDQWIEKI